MIFASDLDRTLIYSKRAMGGSHDEASVIPVELYQGQHISFISPETARLLSELAKTALFVPVTTRTIEQYERIFYIRETLNPQYAVTSNGGNVLVDGKPDPDWQRHVAEALARSEDAEKVIEAFDRISSPHWVKSYRHSDNLFYSVILDREKMPLDVVEQFRQELAAMKWNLSVQGRKMYLVPDGVSKGAALLHVKERTGASRIAASGDSLLDESLLKAADFAIVPRHGEIYAAYMESGVYTFTERDGMGAAEDLIVKVSEWFARPPEEVGLPRP
ncbi:HAD family hydrolase [Saccharibacillus sp. CPCC 101409]|uniref:HAD family hydrolase n=1 Tax=Saccharibacillus sp. CPCC 101409 TaxID=3058041 RepID=UPI002672B14D|nr:HAD family hydrolase [Saccharibacillus sp. CPCC 101409]MDO3408526.1 HAD family hydrolase [Saccharibacillus sp. CPCC 101409]